MRVFRHILVFALILCTLHGAFFARDALAQDSASGSGVRTAQAALESPVWSPEWGHPGWENVVVTGVLLSSALAINIGLDNYAPPRWRGPILADRVVHESLRASTPAGVKVAGRISDALVGSLILTPLVVEPTLIYLKSDDSTAAGRLALVNAQSMALVLFTTTALKHAFGRQRPPLGDCWSDPHADPSCATRETVSFPSGHSSMAFVGAGLICLNHEVFSPLGGAWDRVACYGALGAAASTGVLRMVAHQHYLSDVLVGAALGLAAGYLLPKALYFGSRDGEAMPAENAGALAPPGATIQLVSLSTLW